MTASSKSTRRSMSLLAAIGVLAVMGSVSGCARIETGEVGLRRNFKKEIEPQELQPGTLNQTIIGDVLIFPVRDIPIELNDKNPLTADNSALKDLDLTFIYSINPSSVSELYKQKSSAFHAKNKDENLLMYNYMMTTVNNAAYKAVRQYKALEVADNRAKIEAEIKNIVAEELRDQKLDTALTVSAVQIRSVVPADEIIKSANEVVRAQNELKSKAIEVETAKKEAERIAALNSNSNAISYMQAQAALTIAEAIKAGKVNTIIVPSDFKGMVNVPAGSGR